MSPHLAEVADSASSVAGLQPRGRTCSVRQMMMRVSCASSHAISINDHRFTHHSLLSVLHKGQGECQSTGARCAQRRSSSDWALWQYQSGFYRAPSGRAPAGRARRELRELLARVHRVVPGPRAQRVAHEGIGGGRHQSQRRRDRGERGRRVVRPHAARVVTRGFGAQLRLTLVGTRAPT